MKMVALRSQDAPDIVALSVTLGLLGEPAAAFGALLRQVYPNGSHLALLLGVADDDLDDEIAGVARAVARLVSRPQGATTR